MVEVLLVVVVALEVVEEVLPLVVEDLLEEEELLPLPLPPLPPGCRVPE